MKTFTILAAASALAIAAPAFAQSAERIDARISAIDTTLDARVRSGVLTTAEQQALRDRLQAVRRNKDAAAADGLTNAEARDIMAKLDAIEAGIKTQARDAQSTTPNTSDSFAEFQARIDSMTARLQAGEADKSLTAAEVAGVKTNLDRLKSRLAEAQADNVLSPAERQDLNTRLQVVSGGLARQRNDDQGMQ